MGNFESPGMVFVTGEAADRHSKAWELYFQTRDPQALIEAGIIAGVVEDDEDDLALDEGDEVE